MPERIDRRDAGWAALLGLGLLAVYHANGGLLLNNDALPNLYLPLSLLEEGNLSFSPPEVPFLFDWEVVGADGSTPLAVNRWHPELAALHDAGLLRVAGHKYYLVPATQPGLYVNMFAPGAGLSAVPLFALLVAVGADLANQPWLVCYAGKFAAAAAVAASAVCVFLAARYHLDRPPALATALIYGLGTSVWTLSSQALLQHGSAAFFLALAVLFLSPAQIGAWRGAAAGAALSGAVLCRPTNLLVALILGGYLVAYQRRALLPWIAGALPGLAALAAYNAHYLGSPLAFGQTIWARDFLATQPGAGGVWSTPLWLGVAGQLVSPSRGLLVYSPVMLFAIAGGVTLWRPGGPPLLRALGLAALAILLVHGKWFCWHGGHDFAYRLIVDAMPLLALLLVPVWSWLVRWRALAAVFALTAAWSIGVQALGATAFTLSAWNARPGYEVAVDGRVLATFLAPHQAAQFARQAGGRVRAAALDVDRPQNAHRLWSLSDNQLAFLAAHWPRLRQAKALALADYFDYLGGPPNHFTHYALAQAYENLDRPAEAERHLRQALGQRPDFAAAALNLGSLMANARRYGEAAAQFARVVELEPHNALARGQLGNVLFEVGRFDEAAEQFARVPDDAPSAGPIRLRRAEALARLGRGPEALAELEAMAAAFPQSAEVLRRLAWLRATSSDERVRSAAAALAAAQRAQQLAESGDPRAADTLAAAYAEAGRWDEALATARRALSLAQRAGDASLAAAIQRRLDRYANHQPYRDDAP